MSLKVRILAADSMGVRSIATFVEACGVPIGVDLGASIAPRRFGLPPHPKELKRLEQSLDVARRMVAESSIVVVTHYHYDHYLRDDAELYIGKMLLVKDIRSDINRSQALRGYRFLVKSGLSDRARVEPADSRTFTFEGVTLRFSHPVWHGEEGTKLGKVLMVSIECEEGKIVFASDVQGPPSRDALEWLLREARGADILVISGPAIYLAGYKVGSDAVKRGLEGLSEIALRAAPKILVVDHHFLRDLRYESHLEAIRSKAKEKELSVEILTAAEFMGKPLEPLEALRRELWGEESGENEEESEASE